MTKQPDFRLFAGLAAASLLVGGFMVYSQYNGVAEQQERVAKIQKEVDDAAGVRNRLADSETHLADIQRRLAHLEKGIPDYAYIPTLLRELEQFGKTNGIQVTGVRPVIAKVSASPDENAERKAYDEMTIEVKGRGRYDDSLKFLRALHQFPKVVAARTISLQPRPLITDRPGDPPNLEIAIELKIFVFPQVKEPTVDATADATKVAVKEVPNNG
ncbi:MAG TPA: type 4a pilus biogenesis protein PilO [Fimbriimonas sp.]|nr:type 4a pilus biogenesis protein PilO [Fimbriimonas sp.]